MYCQSLLCILSIPSCSLHKNWCHRDCSIILLCHFTSIINNKYVSQCLSVLLPCFSKLGTHVRTQARKKSDVEVGLCPPKKGANIHDHFLSCWHGHYLSCWLQQIRSISGLIFGLSNCHELDSEELIDALYRLISLSDNNDSAFSWFEYKDNFWGSTWDLLSLLVRFWSHWGQSEP